MTKLPKTLVIKIGSSILSDVDSGLNKERIELLIKQIAILKKIIPNIIIVSSGAVAAGFKLLGFKTRPKDIVDKQASAAAGQARLIQTYQECFNAYNIAVAQVLLTKDDFNNRKRFLCANLTLKKLLELGAIPIINENDTILVDELKYIETFGDNDHLSALVAGMLDADLLLILSDVDGLYTKDPSKFKDAKKIDTITSINEDIFSLANGGNNLGTGGMESKLKAALKANKAGVEVAIIKGSEPSNIERFFKEENVGSRFLVSKKRAKKKKLWLLYATISKGALIIDSGAKNALESNKSLLIKGVKEIKGEFKSGEIVAVLDSYGNEIARGIAKFDSYTLNNLLSKTNDELFVILKGKSEVIHKDDLALL